MTEAVFAIPGDIDTPTGGYAYDRQVLRRFRAHGIKVHHLALPATFPTPSADDIDETIRRLNDMPRGHPIVIDGLAFGALPAGAVARLQSPLIALVHHPLGLESGLTEADAARLIQNETAVLEHAVAVIVTSSATGRLLASDFGVPAARITVAEPGTERAERARGGQGPSLNILAVGSVVPRKGYDVLIKALAGLVDRAWTLTIIGADDRAPDHASAIRRQVAESALNDRIALAGAVTETVLDAAYAQADIFVLASHFEGFGMVLTEALARGLPIITTTGGAAAETVSDQAALKVPPGNVSALQIALRHLIEDKDQRRALADQAWREAQSLPGWDDTARIISGVIKSHAA
ncbi:glycosyltransferase family 4 protein [Microvirga antarctica]|uniref:glycosyltransferase family 4 protein n=1 Tax=Microvirga antarctica TaxID=2819233 RepID=UPI001B30372A